ncbi:hypothetical protein [Streptomyces sp. NPDC020607]|uniref:hypothetical protein n=1 Tax=Streptomyces sp. NPDC020607 TaxID=3365082 RepID=UPI0037BC652F
MTAARYRKKPVEIDAAQWDGTAEGATQIIQWILANGGTATYTCSDPDRCAETGGDTPHSIGIPTLEGTMQADLGDWIIREPFPTDDRKFYPCKPGIFAATYDPADGGTTSAEQRAEAASRLGTRYMVRAEQAEAAVERARAYAHELRHKDAMGLLAALDEPGPAATEATEPAASALREQIAEALADATGGRWPAQAFLTEADAVLAVILPGTRITATLACMYEADVQRVTALYEQWVKAGPPPLGASMNRWWDARLVELHNAILPPTDHTTEQPCTNESSPQKSPAPSPPEDTPTP